MDMGAKSSNQYLRVELFEVGIRKTIHDSRETKIFVSVDNSIPIHDFT